jgi:hypothetical protein
LDTPDSKLNQADAALPKRYEKPCIDWEQELDVRTLAIACGKDDPLGLPTCQAGVSS